MIFLDTSLSPTQFIGLSAYLFAAISCGVAWGRSRRFSRLAWLAAVLTVLEAGLFLDMAFSIRWHLHDVLKDEAIKEGLYDLRVGPQLAALGLLGVAAAGGIGLTFQ